MKKLLTTLLACTLLLTGCGNGETKNDNAYKIGVLQYLTHDALDAALKGFKDGMNELGYVEGENVVYDVQNPQADQSALAQIAQTLVNNEPDMILAIATPAAQQLQGETKEIPIIGTAITDYEETKLVNTNNNPGANITGTSDGCPMDVQIDLMLKLDPSIKNVGILYTSSEENSVIQARQAEAELTKRGLNVTVKTVSGKNEINDTMEAFGTKIDALYIPTDNNIASAMASVDTVAKQNGILTIVGESNMVKNGGAASVGVDYYKLGKQTAVMADKILKGQAKVEETPIETLSDLDIYVNSNTLKELNISVPSDMAAIDMVE